MSSYNPGPCLTPVPAFAKAPAGMQHNWMKMADPGVPNN